MENEKVVEYHSEAWQQLVCAISRTNIGIFGWTTWEVFECKGKRMALMKWSQL
jgi:hypothetical protein